MPTKSKKEKKVAVPKEGEKIEVIVGKLIRKTPGGRHGWFESNVGIIKKPL